MKKYLLSLFILPTMLFSQNNIKKISCLFLGNSYTFVNNLPLLISNVARANGDTMFYDSNTPGGYTFYNHFYDPTSKAKINTRPWKFVVLQAQSQEPAFSPSQVNIQTLPYAIYLDSLIKKNNKCTNTVFYQTWGRKNGDAQNCAAYPPICTYTGMQDRLKQSYKLFADTVKGIMSPAGEAFRRSIQLNPSLELYDADQSHPSLSGSYLVAAVFYEVLFQKSVLTNTFNPGINNNTLSFLQQVAHATVNDSLGIWNLGVNYPRANFAVNPINNNTFSFQSSGSIYSSTWYFGDGNISNSANPVHQYLNPGTYTVSHVLRDSCNKDSLSNKVTVLATSIKQNLSIDKKLSVYPNPCGDALHIVAPHEFNTEVSTLEITNALGQIIYTSRFEEILNTNGFPKGLYFLKISNGGAVINERFIKNE